LKEISLKKLICARRHQRNFLFPSKKNSSKPGSSTKEFCALKHLPDKYMQYPVERAGNKKDNPNQEENDEPILN